MLLLRFERMCRLSKDSFGSFHQCFLPLSVFVFAVLAVQMAADAQERQNSPLAPAQPAAGAVGYV
ncbi:MAG: hypothetical protein ACKPJJ_15225, partial [Planctomycetaceae bacterium]